MALELHQIEPPVRVRPDTPMSEEEFMSFCAANEPLRFEREPNGEILVITPSGNRTGRTNAYIVYALGAWSQAVATTSIPARVSIFPTAPCAARTRHGLRHRDGMR